MVYLDGISAFEFWTSSARARFDARTTPRVSFLDHCPSCAAESSLVDLKNIPCAFSEIVLAVPDASQRVQRSRFRYRVWPQGIPSGSFLRIARNVCVASPALALAEVNSMLGVERTAQIGCEMSGSYVRMRGPGAGMIDKIAPVLTWEELRSTMDELHGTCKCRVLSKALEFVCSGSRSPKETELYLLLAFSKRRGGAALGEWALNTELEVPREYRSYLGKEHLYPDLYREHDNLAVEYDSAWGHGTENRRHEDRKREIVLEAMGNEVISVQPEHLNDADTFEWVVKKVKKALGIAYQPTSEKGLAARERLMATLRDYPSFGYPL